MIINLDLQEAEPVAAVQEIVVRKDVHSIQYKLNDVTVNEDGSVTHNVFIAKDGSGNLRKFKDQETFKRWVAKHTRERKEELKSRLSP